MEWEPHRPSAPGTPSSMSSGNSGGSSARAEKTPNFKQLSPSPSVAALSKIPDAELRMKGPDELVRILRRVEVDYKSLLGEHGNVVKDVNRRLQIFVLETRSLKETVHKLQEDNQELRDLCCFLDDDRQKGRKLAREWQRFGRYTASVMRSEVAVYQEKLKELEERQSELITENMDLKELCLYLDQERLRTTGDRDEGDGSSNGTITGPEDGLVSPAAVETSGSVTPTPATSAGNYPTTPSSTASYIKELEFKIQKLEEDKKHLTKRVNESGTEGSTKAHAHLDGSLDNDGLINAHPNKSVPAWTSGVRKSPVASKPEAVVHAMKVLEVHEELEKSATEDDLDAPEKAIVREMCNVVWRKLGDVGDVGSLNESSDSILDPPFLVQSPGKPGQAALPSPAAAPPTPLSQGQAHSYSLPQPQPQMASTPLAAAPLRTGQNEQNDNGPNQANRKPMLQVGERNPMPKTSQEPASYYAGPSGQQQQQQQPPPQLPYHLNQQQQQHHHQQQPTTIMHGQGGLLPHHHMNAPGPKPSAQNQFPPSSSFAPIQQPSHHSESQRPPPVSLPHHIINNSGGGANPPSSAKDTPHQRPLASPTKSLSDHLPFSHPNFQHHQPHHFNHPPAHQQPPPTVPTSHRPGDQRPQPPHFSHGQLPMYSTLSQGQPQISQSAQPSLTSRSSSAPQRPHNQHQQYQYQQQQHPQLQHQYQQPQQPQQSRSSGQQDGSSSSGGPPHHQPSTVRLLGAPGNRGRPAESGDKLRSGPGPASNNYPRAAPGGPPQPQSSASQNRTMGPSLRPGLDTGPPHSQPKHRGQGSDGQDALPYEKRGMLTNRDSALPPNPSSSDSNPYGPLPHPQDGLRTSGFRAYPPQPSALPGQPGSGLGMGRFTNATDRASYNPGQPQPPNLHRGPPGMGQPNMSGPFGSNAATHGKNFQEQEWRQTYLDDSDTL